MARAAVKKPSFEDLAAQAKKLPPAQRVRLISLLTEDLENKAPRPVQRPKQPLTAKGLLGSGLVGLWKDREDIRDSAAFARTLRERSPKSHLSHGLGLLDALRRERRCQVSAFPKSQQASTSAKTPPTTRATTKRKPPMA